MICKLFISQKREISDKFVILSILKLLFAAFLLVFSSLHLHLSVKHLSSSQLCFGDSPIYKQAKNWGDKFLKYYELRFNLFSTFVKE